MEGLKKFCRTLGVFSISAVSFTYWWGALNAMATEAKYVTHYGIIDKHRSVLTVELVMLLVAFVQFIASLGVIARNGLSRKIFTGSTCILLLYNVVVFFIFSFGIIRTNRAQSLHFLYQGIIYILFCTLSLAYVFIVSRNNFFQKDQHISQG